MKSYCYCLRNNFMRPYNSSVSCLLSKELRRELTNAPLFRSSSHAISLNRSDKGRAFLCLFEKKHLSMADAHGHDLAESLQSLFTNVSSMVKAELQGTNSEMDLLEKMNVRVAAEYDDLGDVAAGLRVYTEQMKSKSGGLDEFVGQMDEIEKQVFEAVISVLDRYVSILESKVRA
ncbi:hypothetical protein Bca4012_014128 [Brassica carinata]